jgi:SOS-response transcriptional repressor LexA
MLKKLTPYWEDMYTGKSLDKFLQAVKDYFEEDEIKEDAVRQLHRYSQLEDLRKKGVINNSDYIEKQSGISTAAFDILERIANEYLPILPVKAVAGNNSGPYYLIEYKEIEEWRLVKRGDIRNRIGIRVEGDSMNPIYLDGDILICKKTTIENVSERQPLIVVGRDNSIFLKNIKREGSMLELISLNSEYKPFKMPLRDVVEFWLVESKIK